MTYRNANKNAKLNDKLHIETGLWVTDGETVTKLTYRKTEKKQTLSRRVARQIKLADRNSR